MDAERREELWETYGHVEALIVHFVEMEDRARSLGRKKALDYAEAVLGVGAIFDGTPEVCMILVSSRPPTGTSMYGAGWAGGETFIGQAVATVHSPA